MGPGSHGDRRHASVTQDLQEEVSALPGPRSDSRDDGQAGTLGGVLERGVQGRLAGQARSRGRCNGDPALAGRAMLLE